MKRSLQPQPATVYESYARLGGGRTHLMPVTLWASEVTAPDGYQHVSAWIVPMFVETDSYGLPLCVGMIEGRAVNVEGRCR